MVVPILFNKSLMHTFWDIRVQLDSNLVFRIIEPTPTLPGDMTISRYSLTLLCCETSDDDLNSTHLDKLSTRLMDCFRRFNHVIILVRCIEPTMIHSERMIRLQDYVTKCVLKNSLNLHLPLVFQPVYEPHHISEALCTFVTGLDSEQLYQSRAYVDLATSTHPELGGCSRNDRWAQILSLCTKNHGGLTMHEMYVLQDGLGSFKSVITSSRQQLQNCSLDKSTAQSIHDFFHLN
ncbi:hypothetical protein BDV3_002426 [Batrachochytrium dendrobatidis]